MSECTCHKNYTLDTLIPKVGVITKITQETPDVKNILCNCSGRRKTVRTYAGTVCNGMCTGCRRGNVLHYFIPYK